MISSAEREEGRSGGPKGGQGGMETEDRVEEGVGCWSNDEVMGIGSREGREREGEGEGTESAFANPNDSTDGPET
jgi:hypothetical protein